MPWTERHQAMLRAMGLRAWQPAGAGGGAPAPAPARAPSEAPAPAAEPVPATSRVSGPEAISSRHAAAPRVPQAPLPGELVANVAPTPDASVDTLNTTAVAGLDWATLREAVASCRGCRLCESRKQTVFGVGHPQAHWMIVGEAPGAQEDEQGEPFVGAAGQLLDAMLRALGLDRSAEGDPATHVYIANTLKCRPPGNRNPQADEMQRCEPYLVRQIQLVRPRLILAMGRFAVQALLRTTEPIGRLRGREHRYQGVPLVVTYHPAYLLRNLADKARAWEDLCLAAEVMARQAGAAGDAGEIARAATAP